MLVMDRQDYINKSNNVLAPSVYRSIPKDTTNKTKAKLITILKMVKNHTLMVPVFYMVVLGQPIFNV